LTLAQVKKLGGVEWPLWLEAVRKGLSSLIIENEVFDVIEYEDVDPMFQLRSETKYATCWYYSSVNVINIKKLPNTKHEW
jgi:hypothetical protein